jgi:hypothetical protein
MITSRNGEQQPMPSVAYTQPANSDQFDGPGIDTGFNTDSSFRVPPQRTDGADISRNVKPARSESDAPSTHSTDPGDRFGGTGRATPDRHIL